MADNRKVGSPKNNPARMEPRSVAVQTDKPRINDERKVRPHTSGDPAMGGRPSGGAQKPAGEFSDKLAGDYIGAREVPMDSIHEAGDVRVVHNKLLGGHYIVRGPHQTPIGGKFNSRAEALAHLNRGGNKPKPTAVKTNESELNEWNPFERFYKSRQESIIPGITVGYQVTKDGIDLQILQDSRPIAHKRVDSHQGISTKMQQLKKEYDNLKQQRIALSINPDRVGRQAAWQFAQEKGVQPRKVGMLNRDIPTAMGDQAAPQAAPAQPQPQPAPTASPRPGAAPMRPGAGMRRPKPAPAAPTVGWGHRGEPMGNLRKEWDRRSGQKPDFNVDRSGAARPGAPMPVPANEPGQMRGMPLPNIPSDKIDEILMTANSNGVDKGFWTPERVKSASELNKRQAAQKFLTSRHTRANPMAAESIEEGYPDTSFERGQPAHTARIGDLGWKGKGKQPGVPSANKGFMQAIDLHIEKVTEMADSDIDDMITRTMNRLGLEEAMHGGPEADTVTLPAYWASALVNGDFSSLDEEEANQCEMVMHKLAQEGWQVVGTTDEEPHFTSNYQVHNPHSQYSGGDVMTYIVHKARGAAMPPQHGMQQHESYTGSVSRGPQGAAPIAETKLPRSRARWV